MARMAPGWLRRRTTRPAPLRSVPCRGETGKRGEVVTGSSFYVWDQNPRYARAWAAELEGVRPARATDAGS